MLELIEQLNRADIAYYRDDAPIMPDREYDLLMDELKGLEHDTGLTLSGSPTQKVSGEILEELNAGTATRNRCCRRIKPSPLRIWSSLPSDEP